MPRVGRGVTRFGFETGMGRKWSATRVVEQQQTTDLTRTEQITDLTEEKDMDQPASQPREPLFPDRRTSTHLRVALQSILQADVQTVLFIITRQDTSVLDLFLSMRHQQSITYEHIHVVLSDDICRLEEMLFDAMDHPYVCNSRIGIISLQNVRTLFD